MSSTSSPQRSPEQTVPAWTPGPASALTALCGVLALNYLSLLPSPCLLLLLLAASLWLLFRWRAHRGAWLALAVAWMCWTGLHAHWRIAERLDPALDDTRQLALGSVIDLPRQYGQTWVFDFRPDRGQELPPRIRVSWYNPRDPVRSGERYQLLLQVTAPHGLHNPGGFDAERWALERRLGAYARVRAGPDSRRLGQPGGGLHGLRERIAAAVASASIREDTLALVQALAVGDQRALSAQHRERLQLTGTGHLMAISGLHVGLAAAAGGLLMWLLHALFPRLSLYCPRAVAMAALGLISAAGYAALAGFALPTQRALLMLTAITVAWLLRRNPAPAQGLALALLAVLLVDPLAVLSGSFWLSFAAVGLLLMLASRSGQRRGTRGLLRAQWMLTLGLAPLGLLWFGAASVSSLLANLIAVPWVSLLIVPPTLLGVALELMHEGAGQGLFALAANLLVPLWVLLGWIAELPMAALSRPGLGTTTLLFAVLGLALLLMPRGMPGRWFALPLLLPLLLPAQPVPASGTADIHVLDVGHGQAVLVRTRSHALLYDTGPRAAGGSPSGERVLLPTLAALGVHRLDGIVMSHADATRSGGLDSLRDTLQAGWAISSAPAQHAPASHCLEGHSWIWDGVEFTLLHPPRYMPYAGRNSACVLRIRTQGAGALIAGSVEAVVESRLVKAYGAEGLRSELLVSGHHGARASSSQPFLQAVAPQWVLHSAGHQNRWQLPHSETVQRVAGAGSGQLSTAQSGAIRFRLGVEGLSAPSQQRNDRPRYWHTVRHGAMPLEHPVDRQWHSRHERRAPAEQVPASTHAN